MRILLPILLACLALLALAMNAEADLVVETDTTWSLEDRDVVGDLVVERDAELVLQGVDLRVAQSIRVETGARLVIGPDGDTPSTIGPLNESQGFWIQVQGDLEIDGTPATRISGLRGEGIATSVHLNGGLAVNGTATLRDVRIGPAEGPVAVGPGGRLHLERTHLDALGLTGLTLLSGRADVVDTTITNHSLSITGKGACHLDVQDSHVHGFVAGFQMVGCDTTIERTTIKESAAAVVLNGRRPTVIEDSVFEGYVRSGIQADGTGDIIVRDSRFVPAEQARQAIELGPKNNLSLHHVDVATGNGVGIKSQSSQVHLEHTRFLHGRQSAINFTGGALHLGESVRFEGADGVPPVAKWAFVQVSAREEAEVVPGLSLRVLDREGRTVFSGGPGDTLMVFFNTYGTDDHGNPMWLGPFQYEAGHPLGLANATGALDTGRRVFTLQVAEHDHDARAVPGVGPAVVVLLALLAVRRRH